MSLHVKAVRRSEDFFAFLNLPGIISRRVSTNAGQHPSPSISLPPPPARGDAEYCYFLATENGFPVGRVAASFDSRFPDKEAGFFGAFESVESREVAGTLLENAARWLAAQKRKKMIGPVTLNTNQQVGLLVEGFQEPPAPFVPSNPPYYSGLLESLGLVKYTDLFSFHYSLVTVLPPLLSKVADRAGQRQGLKVHSLSLFNFRQNAEAVLFILNSGMAGNWGFLPLTSGEARGLVRYCLFRGEPSLALLATVKGKPAALSFTFPPAASGQIPRLALLAVVPEFRGLGLEALLIVKTVRILSGLGYAVFEVSQVEENNAAALKIITKFNCRLTKRHRLYQAVLA